MSPLLNYSPQPVVIPPNSQVTRSSKLGFSGRLRLSEKEERSYDAQTLFYDSFLSPDRQKLLCLGPPFLNIGPPQKIVQDNRPLRFLQGKGSYWFNNQVLALVSIDILNHQDPIYFKFKHFSLSIAFPSQPRPNLKRAQLTLITLQKDNPVLWIKDWCCWHNKIHQVARIAIYDNDSGNWTQLRQALTELRLDCEILLIGWPFPYGPTFSHLHQYTQIGCLNHFRLLFGDSSQWCMQLDMDEYLHSGTKRSIRQHLTGIPSQPALYLDSYLVPRQVESSRPIRFFHHSVRPHWTRLWAGKKYIYQPGRVKLNLVHRVIPRRLSLFHLGYGTRKRWDIAYKFFITLLKSRPRQQKRLFFFYHFRALNTGWKDKARSARPMKENAVHSSEYIMDENLVTMAARMKE